MGRLLRTRTGYCEVQANFIGTYSFTHLRIFNSPELSNWFLPPERHAMNGWADEE